MIKLRGAHLYDVDVHNNDACENDEMVHVAAPSSSLSWIEWILQREVEVHTYEELDAQIDQSKCICLGSKENYQHLKNAIKSFVCDNLRAYKGYVSVAI